MIDCTNLYCYVHQNPIVYKDPGGTDSESAASADRPGASGSPQENVHVIIVGTDAPPSEDAAHKSKESFTKRVNTLINKDTALEHFPERVDEKDRIS